MTDERKNLHDQLDTLLASDIDKADVETALKQLLATQSERSSEPILQESENRYVLLPIKYPDVWELYQKAVASFWVPNEVDLKSDVGGLGQQTQLQRTRIHQERFGFFRSIGFHRQREFGREVQLRDHDPRSQVLLCLPECDGIYPLCRSRDEDPDK